MKSPMFLQLHRDNQEAIRRELLAGLQAPAAHTSPKYLYDALGSRLFEAITELPEYDLTRLEASVLAENVGHMRQVPAGATWIDLGAGNCKKSASLFGQFKPKQYVAIDISVDFLREAMVSLQLQHPALDMVGIGVDFSAGLVVPDGLSDPSGPRVLFYPGSSIGNFAPSEAERFLRSIRAACGQHPASGLLIGVDLVKDVRQLEAAYDDALGVTAAFNLNLLRHINQLAGTDFNVRDWRHLAVFSQALSRIEMHLEARALTVVRWSGGERIFQAGECIHTESSYKWSVADFEALLFCSGFGACQAWTDMNRRFAIFWAGV